MKLTQQFFVSVCGKTVAMGCGQGLLEIKTSPSWDELFEGEVPVDWTYQARWEALDLQGETMSALPISLEGVKR